MGGTGSDGDRGGRTRRHRRAVRSQERTRLHAFSAGVEQHRPLVQVMRLCASLPYAPLLLPFPQRTRAWQTPRCATGQRSAGAHPFHSAPRWDRRIGPQTIGQAPTRCRDTLPATRNGGVTRLSFVGESGLGEQDDAPYFIGTSSNLPFSYCQSRIASRCVNLSLRIACHADRYVRFS